jgi:hypothetical protein
MNVLKIFIFCFISALAGLSAADCPNVRTQYSGGSYGKSGTDVSTRTSRQCACRITVVIKERDHSRPNDLDRSVAFGVYQYFQTPFEYGENFPKSQIFLDNYFKETNRCPDEANFQSLLKVWREEVVEKSEKAAADQIKLDIDLAPRRSELKRNCQGAPNFYTKTLEGFSADLRVNPASISLKRLELNFDGLRCKGTFYTPIGPKTCDLDFDSAGVVKSIGRCS